MVTYQTIFEIHKTKATIIGFRISRTARSCLWSIGRILRIPAKRRMRANGPLIMPASRSVSSLRRHELRAEAFG